HGARLQHAGTGDRCFCEARWALAMRAIAPHPAHEEINLRRLVVSTKATCCTSPELAGKLRHTFSAATLIAMKVEVEKQPGSVSRLQIELPADEVTRE